MGIDMLLRITKVYPSGDLIPQMMPHMQSLGSAIGRRAQRLVPKRTYALHDSIFTETAATDTKIVTTIGMGTGYGLHVEKGTSRQRAQPFMRPALLQSTSRDLNGAATDLARHGIVTRTTSTSRSRRNARRRNAGR